MTLRLGVLATGSVVAAAALVGCGNSSQPAWVTQAGSSAVSAAQAGSARPASTAGASAAGSGASSGMASATSTTATSTTGTSTSTTTVTASASVTEPAATDVQRTLQAMNYDVAVTGKYDTRTRAAVKRFQSKHGLPQTGIVDNATNSTLTSALASFQATATRTDAEGYVFDGAFWRADEYYRSKNRQCVVYEQQWQTAVDENVGSASVSAHDKAQKLGCNPDVWTQASAYHPTSMESHTDGEACTSAELGTIAKGSMPWAVCNQVRSNVYEWKVMSN